MSKPVFHPKNTMASSFVGNSRSWSSLFAAPSEQIAARGESSGTPVPPTPATTVRPVVEQVAPFVPPVKKSIWTRIGICEELGKRIEDPEILMTRDDLRLLSFSETMKFDAWIKKGRPLKSQFELAVRDWADKKNIPVENAFIRFLISNHVEAVKKEFAYHERPPVEYFECRHPDLSTDLHYHVDGTEIPGHSKVELQELLDLQYDLEYELKANYLRPMRFKVADPLIPPNVKNELFYVKACHVACRFWKLVYAGRLDPEVAEIVLTEELMQRDNAGCVNYEQEVKEKNLEFAQEHKWKGNWTLHLPDKFKELYVKKTGIDEDYLPHEDDDPECVGFDDEFGVFHAFGEKPSTVEIEEVFDEEPVEEEKFETPMETDEELMEFETASEGTVSEDPVIPPPVPCVQPLPVIVLKDKQEVLQCLYQKHVDLPGIRKYLGMMSVYDTEMLLSCLNNEENFFYWVNECLSLLVVPEEEVLLDDPAIVSFIRAPLEVEDPCIIAYSNGEKHFSVVGPEAEKLLEDPQQVFDHMCKSSVMYFDRKFGPLVHLCPHTVSSYLHCVCGMCDQKDPLHLSFAQKREQFVFPPPPVLSEHEAPFKDLTVCGDVEKNPGPTFVLLGSVQGDDQPKETETNFTKTANVTFVDEREVEQDSTHLGAAVSSKDPNNDMAESQWSETEILTRYLFIDQVKWGADQANGILYETGIPDLIFKKDKSVVATLLKTKRFIHAGAEMKIVTNINRFTSGKAVAYLVPPFWKDDWGAYSWEHNVLVYPHVIIDAASSNSVVLMVPYSHPLSHFCMSASTLADGDSFQTLGKLIIRQLTPLRPAKDSINAIYMSVYARFVNPELHHPSFPIPHLLRADGQVQAKEEGFLKGILGRGLSTALGAALTTMTGGVAAGIGSALTGLIFDKPRDPMPANPIENRSVQPFCHGAGLDNCTRLALTNVSEQSQSLAHLGGSIDDYSLQRLCQMECLVKEYILSTDIPPQTLVFALPVCPSYVEESIENEYYQRYIPSMLAYVSRPFCYCRGGKSFMRYHFVLDSTDFHSLRLMFAFDPASYGSAYPVFEELAQQDCVIIDIEEQKEFTIDVPFMSVKPWLRCDNFRTETNFTNNEFLDMVGTSNVGFLYCFIVNSLVAPGNVTPKVHMLVYVSGGSDYELAIPSTLDPLFPEDVRLKPLGPSVLRYPFVNSTWVSKDDYSNMEFINSLYREGEFLYSEHLVNQFTKYFFDAVPNEYASHNRQVNTWIWNVRKLRAYYCNAQVGYNQRQFINACPKWTRSDQPRTQAIEENATSRGGEPPAICITKNAFSSDVRSSTISENAMNLQTVLRRYYCLFNSFPVYCNVGYTCITVPVTPTFIPYPIDSFAKFFPDAPATNHLAWFARIFTYQSGGLRYILCMSEKGADAIICHVPTEAREFNVQSGVNPEEVQRILAYASVMAQTNTQNSLAVEVPYASTYNMLLMSASTKPDLRAQNGTLFIFLRGAAAATTALTFTLMVSTADDFLMNTIKAPPSVCEYHVRVAAANSTVMEGEARRSNRNDGKKIQTPDWTGFNYLSNSLAPAYANPLEGGTLPDCKPLFAEPNNEENKAQALDLIPKETTAKVNRVLDKVDRVVTKIEDESVVEQLLSTSSKISSAAEDVSSSLSTLEESALYKNLIQVTSTLQEKLENVPSASACVQDTVSRYTVVAAEIATAGAVLHCVRQCIENPSFGSFLTLGLSFAALLGIATSSSLQNLISSSINWVMDSPKSVKLGRAQALDGPAAEIFSKCEKEITTVVAVIGTIIYAFLFDALPKWGDVKAKIKNFFQEDDSPKAQFAIKNAHFGLLGLTALQKVYEKIMALVQQFIDWLLDRENPENVTRGLTDAVRERVLAVAKELDELDDEACIMQALKDPLAHNRFYKMYGEVEALTEMSLIQKDVFDNRLCMYLKELRVRAVKLIQKFYSSRPLPKIRYLPICVALVGDTGVGKTTFTSTIEDLIAEEMDLSPYNRTYVKNVADRYSSGYQRQPLVLWDEFAQCKDNDDKIAEFCNMVSNRPFTLNMADLADKGMPFTSQAIIMTSNSVRPEISGSVREPEAVYRRRHIFIQMTFRQGYNQQMMNQAGPEFAEYPHCNFTLLDGETCRVIRDNLSYQDVIYHIRQTVRAWHARQLARLGDDLEVNAPILPRGIVPMVDGEVLEDPDEAPHLQVPQEEIDNMYAAIPDQYRPADELGLAQGVDCVRHKLAFTISKKVALDDLDRYLCEAWLRNLPDDKVLQFALYSTWRNTGTRISRLYAVGKKFFLDTKTRLLNWYAENPKISKLFGVMAVLAASLGVALCVTNSHHEEEKSVLESRLENVEAAYDSHSSRPKTVRVIPEGSYEHNSSRPKVARIIPEGSYDTSSSRPRFTRVLGSGQGSEDPVAMDIKNRIHPYVYPMAWMRGSASNRAMKCFHVKGHCILAPHHFFRGALEGDRFALFHRVLDVVIEFRSDHLYRDGENDWCIYDCGPRLEPSKHNMKYFIRERDLGKVGKVPGVLLSVSPDMAYSAAYGMIEPIRKFGYKDDKYGDTYFAKGWSFGFPTRPGDCGSILMGVHSSVPQPGKVLGIHVAGSADQNSGFSVIITREALEGLLDRVGVQVSSFGPIQCVDNKCDVVKEARVCPAGDYSLIGIMPPKHAPSQPIKTTFVQTPWFSKVEQESPPPKIPAHLRPFTAPDGTKISPLSKALTKYGYQTFPFPSRNIRKVRNHLCHLFSQKLYRHTGKRVFPNREAILGIPGVEFAERINMKSSPGWPYQVLEKQQPGKFYLFDNDGNIVSPLLQHLLDDRLEKAAHCERSTSVWRDCLKDELRPKAKVEEGKTRLFTIAPVDFTIAVRKYFLDFVLSFYTHNLQFFSAVGINPESFEWTTLYDRLREVGDSTIAGDFSSFDGTIPPELIMMVCDCINFWYSDSQENQNVRTTLFMEMCHTVQLVENLVYMTHQGNPSGNPMTVVLNTIVGYSYFCLAWLEIYPDKTLHDFDKVVQSFHYGDDNITTVKQGFEKYNFNTVREVLANYNIVYTADTKIVGEDVPDYRPLDECTFLKRGFRRDPTFGKSFVLPTMSLETLHAFFYYYRKSPNPAEQLAENMHAALAFAVYHGEAFYTSYQEKWISLMRAQNFEYPYVSFEEQVDVFLSTCGISIHPTLEAIRHQNKHGVIESMEKFMNVTSSKTFRCLTGFFQAPLYYIAAAVPSTSKPSNHVRDDSRYAVAIPSGEGKSWLAKQYPSIFVDHDELLLPLFKLKDATKGKLPWDAAEARKHDFPPSDRRILLTHHPDNTRRQMVGSFITHYPSFIRSNIFHRLKLKEPYVMSREERNLHLLTIARELEPSLFD